MRLCIPSVAVLAYLLSPQSPAFGQTLSLGVIAGASLTGDFQTGSYFYPGGTLPGGQTTSSIYLVSPLSRSLIIGPKLELRLPGRWSLQVDALHRTLRSKTTLTTYPSGGTQSSFGLDTRTHASWEFPVLAKYRVPVRSLHPFLEAGAAFRPAGSGTPVTHLGATAGAGVETHTYIA